MFNLHIERLVLEGVALDATHGPRLVAAVRTELSQLLGQGTWAPAAEGGVTPRLAGPDLSVSAAPRPESLGRQIAESIHRARSR